MTPPARLLAGAAGLLLATACAVVPEVPRPLPSLSGSPEAFLQRLAADESTVSTVRGLASVRYDGPAGGGSASQVIVVALPDHARLETLTPFGTVAFVLAIRGEALVVDAPIRHEYGVGRATRETLERLARVPIPPGPLLRLLVGLPPLPLRSGDPRVRIAVDATGIRVESVDGPLWQRVWTGPDGAVVERGELGETTGPLLRFEFSDRRRLNGAVFPFAIRLDGMPGGTRVGVQYETVRLNEPVEAALFELPRPTDGRTRILDLGAGPPP
jgi:hypothetical protein